MTQPRIVHAWHVSDYAPHTSNDIKEVAINVDQIVSIKPASLTFGGWGDSSLRIDGAVILTAATGGVYTIKNDAYEASRFNKPDTETRGGGSVSYTVLVPFQEAMRRAREGRPFPIPDPLVDWLVTNAQEAAEACRSGKNGWVWMPSAAEKEAFAISCVAIPSGKPETPAPLDP